MESFNVVLLGENFPIASIDLGDFDFLGRPAKEVVRLPVALEARAGEFKILVIPERFQVGAVEAKPTSDKVEAVKNGAVKFLEYTGRRTIRAVGHNFSIALEIEGNDDPLAPLVSYESLKSLLGGDSNPVADLTVGFDTGAEPRGQIKFVTKDRENSILLDFNFHYEITKGESLSVEQAIDQFDASLARATDLLEAIPAAVGNVETTA